jgi:hypothetical protein
MGDISLCPMHSFHAATQSATHNDGAVTVAAPEHCRNVPNRSVHLMVPPDAGQQTYGGCVCKTSCGASYDDSTTFPSRCDLVCCGRIYPHGLQASIATGALQKGTVGMPGCRATSIVRFANQPFYIAVFPTVCCADCYYPANRSFEALSYTDKSDYFWCSTHAGARTRRRMHGCMQTRTQYAHTHAAGALRCSVAKYASMMVQAPNHREPQPLPVSFSHHCLDHELPNELL